METEVINKCPYHDERWGCVVISPAKACLNCINAKWELEEKPNDGGLSEFAQKVEDYYDVGEEHGYLYCHRGDVKDAVIAGATWMKEKMMRLPEIQGWVARDEVGFAPSQKTYLHIYENEPIRNGNGGWHANGFIIDINDSLFPDLKWTDVPKKVKLIIKEDDSK